MKYSISGLQAAQRANLKIMSRVTSDLYGAVQAGTLAAHRYTVAQTHVDTGALRASHRVKIERTWKGPMGTVYIDPSARNPRSRVLAATYGPAEHARGGEHAFYARTVERHGYDIGRQALAVLVRGL